MVVTFGGGHQFVEAVGSNLHGRLKAEGYVGSRQVVVDRFGDTDNRNAFVEQHF